MYLQELTKPDVNIRSPTSASCIFDSHNMSGGATRGAARQGRQRGQTPKVGVQYKKLYMYIYTHTYLNILEPCMHISVCIHTHIKA